MRNIDFKNQLNEWRHYLHMHPESAFEERNTSEYLAKALTDMGLEVHKNIGETGIVANLTIGDGKGIIGLRADMDAINLTEKGQHLYSSQNPGKMHACGHDGHMTTLLGAAKLLSERKNFNGTVRFIFQPAEEPGKGAMAMMDDKLFERFPVDEIYGMHNMPQLPAGTIWTKVGGIMASEDNFVIRIKGKGAHASAPHIGVDPLVIAAEIILALQTIVSRNVNPIDTAVVSCTEIHTDGIRNAIPTNVEIKGDTRSFTPEVQKLIEDRMKRICEGICDFYGAECQFEYTHEFSPTLNWEKCTEIAAQAARNIVGDENVNANCDPMMSSEDFGTFLQRIPGCLVFLGGANSDNKNDVIPLHNSLYDYNDSILETGAEFFAEIVRIRLSK
ncbi:hippurate hydrolase [Clostridium pascui]|uniref:M20 aminoacylase family protein n=1 Tax=Clostridium pascui TaxID=46609 RepID=UPI001959E9B4|nr:M20 aminoacylase family protein [Clostridium pascui]MBM7870270.1 hippurate hydrolase [Clostridium pascui]